MVKLLIDLLEFLRSSAPLAVSLIVITMACVLLSKSIKKRAAVYYSVLAIPFVLVAWPFLARLAGIEISGFVAIPVVGEVVRDYIHMGAFGHPILIIIMYMGALDAKNKRVKRLLSIRRELSIIVGFPVLAHSLVRVVNNLPAAVRFFADRGGYMADTKAVSELGAGISSFSFVLGVVMLVVFIPLWVTSFDGVRRQMSYRRWKSIQKWAYVLYAALFVHAMGIQVGGMLNPRGGGKVKQEVESVVKPQNVPASGKRAPTIGFADFKVSNPTKRYIHIATLILVYGSYLCLRVRKARMSRQRRRVAVSA